MRPPATDTESTRIYFSDPELGEEMNCAQSSSTPMTAGCSVPEPTWLGYLPLSTWLDGLHRHLNLGEPGRIYSELAASWLWVVALGGAYLWIVKAKGDRRRGRPGRLLRADRSVTGRLRTMNWHGATGIWILGMLLFLSATGITWSTYAGAHITDIRTSLNWQRPQLDTALGHEQHHGAAASPATVDPASIDYDAVVAAAGRMGVSTPLEVTLPTGPGEGIGVAEIEKPYRLTTNEVALDPGNPLGDEPHRLLARLFDDREAGRLGDPDAHGLPVRAAQPAAVVRCGAGAGDRHRAGLPHVVAAQADQGLRSGRSDGHRYGAASGGCTPRQSCSVC